MWTCSKISVMFKLIHRKILYRLPFLTEIATFIRMFYPILEFIRFENFEYRSDWKILITGGWWKTALVSIIMIIIDRKTSSVTSVPFCYLNTLTRLPISPVRSKKSKILTKASPHHNCTINIDFFFFAFLSFQYHLLSCWFGKFLQ
jgi:hypothetical protein